MERSEEKILTNEMRRGIKGRQKEESSVVKIRGASSIFVFSWWVQY